MLRPYNAHGGFVFDRLNFAMICQLNLNLFSTLQRGNLSQSSSKFEVKIQPVVVSQCGSQQELEGIMTILSTATAHSLVGVI